MDTALDVDAYAARWETAHPRDLLAEVAGWGGRWTLAMSFQREDTVILHWAMEVGLSLDVFWLDTDLLFSETYAFYETVQSRYPVLWRRIRPALSLTDQAAQYGEALWQRDPHLCCFLRKVEPLFEALAGYDGWITGIRREQSPTRAQAPIISWDARHGLYKLNPLATWTTGQVEAVTEAEDIPVHPLHSQGYPSIGCAPCTRPTRPGESLRAGRWEGWEKFECGIHQ